MILLQNWFNAPTSALLRPGAAGLQQGTAAADLEEAERRLSDPSMVNRPDIRVKDRSGAFMQLSLLLLISCDEEEVLGRECRT